MINFKLIPEKKKFSKYSFGSIFLIAQIIREYNGNQTESLFPINGKKEGGDDNARTSHHKNL